MFHLAAVAGGHIQGGEDDAVGFCSYCGSLGDDSSRVCSKCGLGVRLRTTPQALRAPGAPFLVVGRDGVVSAASAAAERKLSGHGNLVGKPLLALLAPRDGDAHLPRAVAEAAAGSAAVTSLRARLIGARRAFVRATIATCGDPTAALVVLERSL